MLSREGQGTHAIPYCLEAGSRKPFQTTFPYLRKPAKECECNTDLFPTRKKKPDVFSQARATGTQCISRICRICF